MHYVYRKLLALAHCLSKVHGHGTVCTFSGLHKGKNQIYKSIFMPDVQIRIDCPTTFHIFGQVHGLCGWARFRAAQSQSESGSFSLEWHVAFDLYSQLWNGGDAGCFPFMRAVSTRCYIFAHPLLPAADTIQIHSQAQIADHAIPMPVVRSQQGPLQEALCMHSSRWCRARHTIMCSWQLKR